MLWSASGTTTSGTRASPKPGNSPKKWVSEGSTKWVAIRRPWRRNTIEIRWQKERMENIKYGRRREGRWTPIREKTQDTRANPNSWETHLVRKRWALDYYGRWAQGLWWWWWRHWYLNIDYLHATPFTMMSRLHPSRKLLSSERTSISISSLIFWRKLNKKSSQTNL